MTWALQTFTLSKRFPSQGGLSRFISPSTQTRLAVDRVSLSVRQGELFGLLGPNGAGKTTLIKMLSTLILPTSGSAQVFGFPLHQDYAIKASIGLVTSDERSFYWRLTGRQNLEFFAHLHGLAPEVIDDRLNEVLQQTGLEDVASQRFLTYSTGMRQRLSIARALLNRPSLLFLDEPTKGLDPTATHNLQTLIREKLVNERGMTVFLTTHDLQEATRLCDRIAIMHKGVVRACGTLAELRSSLALDDHYTIRVNTLHEDVKAELLRSGLEVELDKPASGTSQPVLRLRANPDGYSLDQTLELLRTHGSAVLEIAREAASLDTIFTLHTQSMNELGASPENETPPASFDPEPAARAETAPVSQPLSLRLAWAFLKRDLIAEASYPVAFLLQIFSIFFSVGVFYYIAQVVGKAASPLLEAYGGDYFSFVLVGIAFNSYFSIGLSSFGGSLRQAQTTGTLEAMLATPTRLSALVIGSSLWDYVLTTIRVLVYLGVGVIFLHVDLGQGNYATALLALALTVLAFSGMGIISASFIMVLKRGDPVTWAFSAFSNLLGGVYYPLSVLPGPLQFIGRLLPITYGLEAMRLALLKGAGLRELSAELLALVAFSLVLLPLSLRIFRLAVRRAKIDGSLTHY